MYGWEDTTPFETVLKATRQRALNRQNLDVDRIKDLGIEYSDTHPQLPNGGYVATKLKDSKGRAMALNESAIAGAMKLLGAKRNFFAGFEDRDALPKMLINKLDNPARQGEHTFKVRTGWTSDEGRFAEVITAILPGSYQIRDANVQLQQFAEMVHENLGPIRGVQVSETGYGDALAYRMIVGNNIMKGTREDAGQHMMFSLRMSENGLFDDEAALGLYRLICANGAMGWDTASIATWSHKTELTDYTNKAGKTITATSRFQQLWSPIFDNMAQAKLEHPAADYLHMMKTRQMITDRHYQMADSHAKSGMEPTDTHYDLYNLLTRGAQDLPSLLQRYQAERKTLKLFTEDGGFVPALDKARIKMEQKEAEAVAAQGNPDPEIPVDPVLADQPGDHRIHRGHFAKQIRAALGN